jgi:hypothetical protein
LADLTPRERAIVRDILAQHPQLSEALAIELALRGCETGAPHEVARENLNA